MSTDRHANTSGAFGGAGTVIVAGWKFKFIDNDNLPKYFICHFNLLKMITILNHVYNLKCPLTAC